MLSQIVKAAVNQWGHVEKIEQEWQAAKDSVDAAIWMLETAKVTLYNQNIV